MKRALVLSGGGAKGAFQYGALRYMMDHEIQGEPLAHYFNIISGVSVGALNGVMLAQNRFDALEKLWENITTQKVYEGNLNIFRIFRKLLTHQLGVMSNKPLLKLIDENISLREVDQEHCDFMFGTVSLDSGLYYTFHTNDFDDEVQFRNGILGSASMPVIWPPVSSISNKDGIQFRQLVDGGVRNVSPLGDVIDYDPDEVIIINCNSEDFKPYPDPAKNMIKIAARALTEITINQIFRQDIREFLHINDIISQLPKDCRVKRTDGTFFKKYKSVLIEPLHDLGDALDFSRYKIESHIQEGYESAKKAFQTSIEHGRRFENEK